MASTADGQHSTPYVNGTTVTFVWDGPHTSLLIGDFNDWGMYGSAPLPMQQLSANHWELTLTFPEDAYLEYVFLANGADMPDPRNPNRRPNGFGGFNSVLRMPKAIPTPLALPQVGVATGKVTSHKLSSARYIVGGERMVHLYQPPVDQPTPLLVCFDGREYAEVVALPTLLDNLIAQGRIAPVSLALVDSSPTGRSVEYACSDAHLGFIIYHVLPFAAQHLNLMEIKHSRAAYGIMGASMGGLMSLYAGLRAPEIFGKVLSQSGAFRSDHLYYRSTLYDLIQAPPPAIKIWMDCALHEWYLAPNRELVPLLKAQGFDVTYSEHNGSHNYPSWQQTVWRGLEYLFPPT